MNCVFKVITSNLKSDKFKMATCPDPAGKNKEFLSRNHVCLPRTLYKHVMLKLHNTENPLRNPLTVL